MKNYGEFREKNKFKKAYNEAAKLEKDLLFPKERQISENIFRLGIVGNNKSVNLHQGYTSVSDILGKLSSIIHMFENYSKDKSQSESCAKMMEIADNLFDLAKIKIVEAQKETISIMNKISEKQGYQHSSQLEKDQS